MTKIKAVVFDVDGTLLDTRELIRVGYIETLRAHGFEEIAQRLEISTLSKPIRESYKELLGNVPEALLERILSHHEDLQNKSTQLVVAYQGLEVLLQEIHAQDILIGIFTSGSRWHVQRNFKQIGIDPSQVFDALVTADDNTARKPAPDGVLLCLERLGRLAPSEVVIVGDHKADIQAGKAAQVYKTIGLLHGLGSEQELQDAKADYIVPSLAALQDLITAL